MNPIIERAGTPAVACSALLGVMVGFIQKIQDHLGRVVADKLADAVALCSLDCEQSARFLLGNANRAPSFALASPNSSRQRTPHKRTLAWKDGNTLAIARLNDTHPENGEASGHPSNPPSTSESQLAASISTTQKQRRRKLRMLLVSAASVYLPVYPLWWISKTSLQPPMILLLATQGWITLSMYLLASLCSCDARMTPNEKS